MTQLKGRIYRLLKWSEKYTKTDMLYLAKGTSWLGIGTGFSWTISLATMWAFANLIPKETYGAYQYILSIVDILAIFNLSGMDTAIARSVAQGRDQTLIHGIKEKIKWGFLGSTGLIIVGIYYLIKDNNVLGFSFIIASIFLPFWETLGVYINYLQGKKRFDLSSSYDVGAQFISAVIVIAALYFNKNLLVILTAYLIGWSMSRAFFFYLTLRRLPPNKASDPGAISYGKHLTAMSVFNSFSTSIDNVLLWHTAGPAPVAVYTFAKSIPFRLAGVTKIVNRLAFPKMATQEMGIIQKTLIPKVGLLTIVAGVIAIMYAVAAPFIFKLFFPQYLEAIPFTQLLSLLVVLQPIGILLNPLTAHAKKNLLYTYNLGMPVLRIVAFVSLIPLWGILGAAIALIIIKILEGFLLFWLFYRA